MTYYEEDQPDEAKELVDDLVEKMGGTFKEPKYNLRRDHDRDMYLLEKAEERHQELMEMFGAIFVQLSRIYDVLLTDSKYRKDLDEKHSAGELFASPPILKEDAWNEVSSKDTDGA